MDAFKVHAESIRRTARQLLAIADRMDPPIVPAKASPVARLICPDCGTEYAGPEYRHGDPCLTEYCVGLISRKSDLAKPRNCNCYYDQQPCNCHTSRTCSCDRCGLRLAGAHRDGSRCESSGPGLGICWGTFRLDPPDEPLTDRQGRPYGVTRDELVAEMIRGYVVGGTDDLPILGLDIASTYGGRL